jgi:hypothetical protein
VPMSEWQKPIFDNEIASLEFQKGLMAPYAFELRALPDYTIVRAHTLAMARHYGLTGPIRDECVQLLCFSVEVTIL